MQDPAQLNDQSLERAIVESIAGATDETIQQQLDAWVPKGSSDYLMQQLGARNVTAEKIQRLLPRVEGLVLQYLSALIRGFLQPREESNYLAHNPLGESERVKFPVHTIDETHDLTAWLAIQRNEFYQRRLGSLLAEYADNAVLSGSAEAGAVDWEAVEIPRYGFTKLLWQRGWLPLQVSPEVFRDPHWLKQNPREKAISLFAHVQRINPNPGDYMHAKDGPEQAVMGFEAELTTAEVATSVATKVSELQQQWQTEREQFLTQASSQLAGAEPDAKAVVAQQVCMDFKQLCSTHAGLEADRLYVNRMRSLHNYWLLPPVEKIERFMNERFGEQVIVCNRVVEVLYHVELLIANLYDYVIRMMSDPELSAPLLVNAARATEAGDVVALTEEEKAQHGLYLVQVLKPRLDKLLGKLQWVNYAEAKRAHVERELARIEREIANHLPRLRREADALPYQVAAVVREGGHNYDVKETDQPDADGVRLGGSRQIRLARLVELAPVDPTADSVNQFEQLQALYAGTAVTAGKLRELFAVGISDPSATLHLLVKNSRLSDPIAAVSHLLIANAAIGHTEMGVSTLTWAYEAFKRADAEVNKTLCLRVYALLRAMSQLATAPAPSQVEVAEAGEEELVVPADWFSQTAYTILQTVADKSGALVDLYWRRDKLFLVAMLKRLVMRVYIGTAAADREALESDETFAFILSTWNYLSVSVKTLQRFKGVSNPVELSGLHTAITAVMKAALAPPRRGRVAPRLPRWEDMVAQRDIMLGEVDPDLALEDQMKQRGLSWGEIIAFQQEMSAYKREVALARQRQVMANLLTDRLDPQLLMQVMQQLQVGGLPQLQDRQVEGEPAQPVGLVAGLSLLMQQQAAIEEPRAAGPAAGGGGDKE
jgi:hypothetical protein